MANVLVENSSLQAIATAIRAKNGSSDTYKPSEMSGAILAIPTGGGGGDITVESKSITANGEYTAPSGKAYSPVTVNVPNSYTAGDEGKVVSNGALVIQTAHAEVTSNGTIDTTLNNSVVVNVSGGGGSGAISVVDTPDAAGGTVRTITAVDISDTTAVAADVASGKYFYTANGTKTVGTASGGGGGEGFPGLLLISSIFNANYNHTNIYTGSETIQDYTGPVELAGGASRIQKAYVRIGPIDLTNISLIQSIISIPRVSNGTSYGRLFIGANADDTAYSVSASQLESVTYYNEDAVHDVLSLDVSGFSGEYYIFTGTDSNGSSWSNSRSVSVFAVAVSADGTPVFEEEPST